MRCPECGNGNILVGSFECNACRVYVPPVHVIYKRAEALRGKLPKSSDLPVDVRLHAPKPTARATKPATDFGG